MKKNNILKALCYILIPVMVAILIVSILFVHYKNNDSINLDGNIDENYFISTYMNKISNASRQLIFNNSEYASIQDGEKTIYYAGTDEDNNVSSRKVTDLYYLIMYKNLVYTNVELTTDTNTVQKVTTYINNQNDKKTSIINGNVSSDTDVISKKALQYFKRFDLKYYKDETLNVADNIEDVNVDEVDKAVSDTQEIRKNAKYSGETWYTTNINDFTIISSYKEEIEEDTYDSKIKGMINDFNNCEGLIYVMIPVSIIVTLMSFVYLIIHIGDEEKNGKVKLSTLDRIYLEIIVAVDCLVFCGVAGLLAETDKYEQFGLVISLSITLYIVGYILCAITGTTIIKRLKAKKFWKTTIVGRLWLWLYRHLKDMNKIIRKSTSRVQRLIILIVLIMLVELALVGIFNLTCGIFIDFIINLCLIYKFIQYIGSYEKIEKKLKNMYEGNNQTKLNEEEVQVEFKDTVKYVNDISNGFENAIQESVKSERMKTELITNVSHDIKTPLTSIINYVDLLKEEDIKNKKAKEYIEVLDSKSQRLKKLIEDLVEASKASTGAIKLNMEDMNLVELLKQSIGEFEDKFDKKGLKVIPTYAVNNVTIKADSRYLYRVIENIFSNISKYALENSRVYVDINEDDNKVILDVKNISKEKLNITEEELIQRFVRGDKSRTTEGSGLGLSIAKSLTELQNGKFTIKIDGDLFKVRIEFNK